MIDTKVDLAEEVRSVQSLLCQNLCKKTNIKIPRREPQGILADILDQPVSKIQDCFGDFGIHIRKFAEHFNFSHPCIQPLVELFTHTSLSAKMQEVLALYESVQDNNAWGVLALYRKIFNESRLAEDLGKLINLVPPLRAINDPGLRMRLRRQGKLSKNAGSVYFSEFDVDTKKWTDYPSSMIGYVRLNEKRLTEEEVEYHKKVIYRFAELGMDNQATAYKNHLASMLSKKNDTYCGFQRVDVEAMLATLGKAHGFVSEGSIVHLPTNNEMLNFLSSSVCLAPKLLSEIMKWMDENWYVTDPTTIADALDCNDCPKNSLSKIFKKFPIFHYRARVYMASNPIVYKLLPKEIEGIIDQLERFHDYGHLPLFDHFLILVPSIYMSELFYNDKNKGYFINDGRMVRDFDRKEDASVFLDLLMVKSRVVAPLLIGQKDDQQYPIGYCF